MSNADVNQRLIDQVINNRDFDAIDDIVAADFAYIDTSLGRLTGPDALKQVLREAVTAFPDLFWVEEEQIASGAALVSRFTWTGTHVGQFRYIPATGRKVTVTGVTINQIVDDQFTETRIIRDDLGFMRQLGYLPERP